jgi:hypothetical protein
MSEKCWQCKQPLKVGDRVFQLAPGKCFDRNITPTYAPEARVLAECHEKCLAEFPLVPQHMPYSCLECEQAIEHGSEVIYGTIGTKPTEGYIRPERRGYNIPFIVHESCFRLELLPWEI